MPCSATVCCAVRPASVVPPRSNTSGTPGRAAGVIVQPQHVRIGRSSTTYTASSPGYWVAWSRSSARLASDIFPVSESARAKFRISVSRAARVVRTTSRPAAGRLPSKRMIPDGRASAKYQSIRPTLLSRTGVANIAATSGPNARRNVARISRSLSITASPPTLSSRSSAVELRFDDLHHSPLRHSPIGSGTGHRDATLDLLVDVEGRDRLRGTARDCARDALVATVQPNRDVERHEIRARRWAPAVANDDPIAAFLSAA